MRNVALIASALVIAFGFTTETRAHSGKVDWEGWSFHYDVKDNAGLVLMDVYRNGEYVIHKASLPAIRVHYKSDCGPYLDQIKKDNMINVLPCDKKVCRQEWTSGDGRKWMRLDVIARIGNYYINQSWQFSNDGWIEAYLYSKGLHCFVDHEHHAYWRIDIDLNGQHNDEILTVDNSVGQVHALEFNEVKNAPSGRMWFIRDHGGQGSGCDGGSAPATGHGIWIQPWDDDGADDFSKLDFAGRAYKEDEDRSWAFGTGEFGYLDADGIRNDVVVWCVGHLHHDAEESGMIAMLAPKADQWHACGFSLYVAP